MINRRRVMRYADMSPVSLNFVSPPRNSEPFFGFDISSVRSYYFEITFFQRNSMNPRGIVHIQIIVGIIVPPGAVRL